MCTLKHVRSDIRWFFFVSRYPTNKWVKLGRFHARDERTVQSFPLNEQMFAKHTKVSENKQHITVIIKWILSFSNSFLSSLTSASDVHQIHEG